MHSYFPGFSIFITNFFFPIFQEFERSRAFLFLSEIKKAFLQLYGLTAATAIAYAMNQEFSLVLAMEMKRFSESKNIDTFSRVHGQIDELKDIMVKNIENVTSRGERLELLVNKAEDLRNTVSDLNLFLKLRLIRLELSERQF